MGDAERLRQARMIFVGADIDDAMADRVCAELLLLASGDARTGIDLYINSPGGSVAAGLAIRDTIKYVGPDVSTWAMGMAAGTAQLLLSAGARGKRYALPHAMIRIGRPATPKNADVAAVTRTVMGAIAQDTGRTVEEIDADAERWFSAQEALDHGLIDRVVSRPPDSWDGNWPGTSPRLRSGTSPRGTSTDATQAPG